MMSDCKKEILSYIIRNRVSSTEIADCLEKQGALDGVHAVNQNMFCAGFIRYVYAHSESNWSVHEQVREVEKDEIVLLDGINIGNRAIVGELVTKYVIYYRMAAALVALGRMRDANDLIKNRYPVWCKGFTPVGCFNHEIPEDEEVKKIAAERKAVYDHALAVCDDTGVVIVPESHLNAGFLTKLEQIEQQEDIWFNCIDFRKWDTFDTVCKKRYLEDQN